MNGEKGMNGEFDKKLEKNNGFCRVANRGWVLLSGKSSMGQNSFKTIHLVSNKLILQNSISKG